MDVLLPKNLEDYISELVHSSAYKGPEEVVSEALREHQLRRQGMAVTMTPELERLLDEGLEDLRFFRVEYAHFRPILVDAPSCIFGSLHYYNLPLRLKLWN